MREDNQATTPGHQKLESATEQSESAGSARRLNLFILLAGVMVALILGGGGYLVGRSSGEDLEAARARGTTLGTTAGERHGEVRGFRAGFAKGKSLSFEVSYNQAYKRAYVEAWEEAGLDAPAKKEIKVSR